MEIVLVIDASREDVTAAARQCPDVVGTAVAAAAAVLPGGRAFKGAAADRGGSSSGMN